MSTKLEFKWKPGTLKSLYVRKVQNGFAVQVVGGDAPADYVFASWTDALQLMSACFCWDMVPGREEVVAERVAQKFPASFLRFEARGAEVRAVFVDSGAQWSRNARELAERIQWLKIYENLTAEELGKWHAVLAELKDFADQMHATAASVVRTIRLRAESFARSATPLGAASS